MRPGQLARIALLVILGWMLLGALGVCVARVIDTATAVAVFYLLTGYAWSQFAVWLVDQSERRDP